MLGQVGRAPTGLLALRLPHVREAIDALPNAGRCNHGPRAHAPLVGKDPATGAWRTAPKKIYPRAMCELIAKAILASLAARVEEPDEFIPRDEDDDALLQFFVSSCETNFARDTYGPDFYRPPARLPRLTAAARIRNALCVPQPDACEGNNSRALACSALLQPCLPSSLPAAPFPPSLPTPLQQLLAKKRAEAKRRQAAGVSRHIRACLTRGGFFHSSPSLPAVPATLHDWWDLARRPLPAP